MVQVMRSAPRRDRGSGFTLIELLVVIAIIALLAAILFPVFARARENARRSSCQSNLKQIGLGIAQYTQDFDEFMPPAVAWKVYGTAQQNAWVPNGTYCGWQNQSTAVSWMDVVEPYVKNSQIYYCPSGVLSYNLHATNTPWKTSTICGNSPTRIKDAPNMNYGYTYNWNALPVWDSRGLDGTTGQPVDIRWHMRKLSQFTNTVGVVLMADRAGVREALQYGPADPNSVVSGAEAWYYGNNPGWKHLETANMLYVDGHVKALSSGQYLANMNTLLGTGTSIEYPAW